MSAALCGLSLATQAQLPPSTLPEVTIETEGGNLVRGRLSVATLPFQTTAGLRQVLVREIIRYSAEAPGKGSLEVAGSPAQPATLAAPQLPVQTASGQVLIPTARILAFGADAAPGGPADPSAGLLFHYRFDRDEKGEVADVTGKHPGLVANAPWTVNGHRNGARRFNGRESFISVEGRETFDALTEFTFCAWVRVDSFPEDFAGIVARRSPANLWWFGLKKRSGLELNVASGGGGGSRVARGSTLGVGRWRHVAMSLKEAGERRVYVDGVVVDRLKMSGRLPRSPDVDLIIGSGLGLDEVFDGTMDEIRFFDRELPPERVELEFRSQP